MAELTNANLAEETERRKAEKAKQEAEAKAKKDADKAKKDADKKAKQEATAKKKAEDQAKKDADRAAKKLREERTGGLAGKARTAKNILVGDRETEEQKWQRAYDLRDRLEKNPTKFYEEYAKAKAKNPYSLETQDYEHAINTFKAGEDVSLPNYKVRDASTGKQKTIEEVKKEDAARKEEAKKEPAVKKETPTEVKKETPKEPVEPKKSTEESIVEDLDEMREKLPEKSKEVSFKQLQDVKDFVSNVDDKYIEGLPKGLWKAYRSNEFGLSKEDALSKLREINEVKGRGKTYTDERGEYLLKHPELASDEEREVIESYKKAKSTLGYFALDAIANGLKNASNAVAGKDIDLNAGAYKEAQKENLSKAIERRNENYGTALENQWRNMTDKLDLDKETMSKLNDIEIDASTKRKLLRLDTETQKDVLDTMAKFKFSAEESFAIAQAKNMIRSDPDATTAIVATLGQQLFDGNKLDTKKLKDTMKALTEGATEGTTSAIEGAFSGLFGWVLGGRR